MFSFVFLRALRVPAFASPYGHRRKMTAKRRFIFGLTIIALLALLAIAAPLVAPHDPLEQDLLNTFQPPAWMENGARAFLLGTTASSRHSLAPDLRCPSGDHGGGRGCDPRRVLGSSWGCWPDTSAAGRRGDLAAGGDMDGVPAGAPVHRARAVLGAGLHTVVIANRGDRLDALLPRGARRSAGTKVPGLRGFRDHDRAYPDGHPAVRDPAQRGAAVRDLAVARDGHRHRGRGHSLFAGFRSPTIPPRGAA